MSGALGEGGSQLLRQVLLARRPIVDADMDVVGYEVLHDPDTVVHTSQQSLRVLYDTLISFGRDYAADGLMVVLPVPDELLRSGQLLGLPAGHVMLELPATVQPSVLADAAAVDAHRDAGFGVLWHDPDGPASLLDGLVHPWDAVKVVVDSELPARSYARLRELASVSDRLLADQVHEPEQFDRALGAGASWVRGFFFARPKPVVGMRLVGLAPAHIELLAAIERDEVDYWEVECAIRSGPTLTDRFLRTLMLAVGWRQVDDVHHGLVLLGERALRRWVTLLVVAETTAQAPAELFVLAATRGRCSEVLARAAGRQATLPAFATGVFSALGRDGVLPGEVVDQLPVDEEVRDALSGRDGWLRQLVELQLDLEAGQFASVEFRAGQLGLAAGEVAGAYQAAVVWASAAVQMAGRYGTSARS